MTNTNMFGWDFRKGTTEFWHFWSDVHTVTVRADKVLNTRADLEDVVTRFQADRTQFDYEDFAVGRKSIKADREYYTMMERRKDFMELVFEYEGKVYKTRTTKLTKTWEIKKKAKILKWFDIQTISLVRDDTDEVITIVRELGKTNHLLDDMTDPENMDDHIVW